MAGYVVVGFLAAFGTLSALWAALGWLLPRGKGLCLVCLGPAEDRVLNRCRWLWAMGFLRCPLLIVGEAPKGPEDSRMEILEPGDLISRLEREKTDGTGNGNPAGHHQRCGISEL